MDPKSIDNKEILNSIEINVIEKNDGYKNTSSINPFRKALLSRKTYIAFCNDKEDAFVYQK